MNELENAKQLILYQQFDVDPSPIFDGIFQITESKSLATVKIHKFLKKSLKDFCPLFMAVSSRFLT